MKKIRLIILALVLSGFVNAQLVPRLETTIKVVSGKTRIAVKAIGGAITGPPSSTSLVIAIPIANAAATLNIPTILDATRLPNGTLLTGSYSDATYKYFLLGYSGPNAPVTFAQNTKYELLELTWGGPNQTCPVTLISLTEGNPSAPSFPYLWQTYLEVSGSQVCDCQNLFYQSATSNVPTQYGGSDPFDYSNGQAFVSTSSTINTILPVNLINFSGYKNGTKNSLHWTTGSEQNNLGFDVQRSNDGINYTVLGFVHSQAPGGTSVTDITYAFDDLNPAGKKQYYRLNQKDIDGRSKLSTVVIINGDKPKTLEIGGLFPNPARDMVNVIINTPQKDNLTLLVMDIAGKTVKQKLVNVDIGSNTVPVDIAGLAQGSYVVKVLCKTSDCELAVGKFNKQ